MTEEAERKANNEAYVPTEPAADTIVLKGPFAAGTSNSEAQKAVKALVMPNVRDVYRTNQHYQILSSENKVKLGVLVKALTGSKMLKVCKDKWHLKRRLPFTADERKQVASEIQEKRLRIRLVENSASVERVVKQLTQEYQVRHYQVGKADEAGNKKITLELASSAEAEKLESSMAKVCRFSDQVMIGKLAEKRLKKAAAKQAAKTVADDQVDLNKSADVEMNNGDSAAAPDADANASFVKLQFKPKAITAPRDFLATLRGILVGNFKARHTTLILSKKSVILHYQDKARAEAFTEELLKIKYKGAGAPQKKTQQKMF